jgi:hypothetical protein
MKKKKQSNPFELFYSFCGTFDKTLKSDYSKQKLKSKGVTFPQFCIVTFAVLMETGDDLLNIKTR